ncbi:hypothetical protein [Roseateles noduli]|uniref:hypothetical protein n=1 Tax=Roseateles noduli TaxID=2052484 RepID=UPI003D64C9B6
MTMIAAFRSIGMPALIGDLLVTQHGNDVGTMKKIVILHPKLAVGYSGKLISIQPAMRALRNWASQNQISKSTLEAFLKSEEMSEHGDGNPYFCNIVGWVIDEDQSSHCFSWWSNYPSGVYYDDTHYQGTGGAEAKALLFEGPKSPDDDDELKRICVFNAAVGLMKEELAPSGRHRDAYGYAFEAIIYNGTQFEYITDSAMYYHVICNFNSERRLTNASINPNLVIVRHRGAFTEVSKVCLGKNREANVNLISSAAATKDEVASATEEMKARLALGFDWSYSVGLEWIRLVYPKVEIPDLYCTRDKAHQTLSIGEAIKYSIEPSFLEWTLSSILEDMQVKAAPNSV